MCTAMSEGKSAHARARSFRFVFGEVIGNPPATPLGAVPRWVIVCSCRSAGRSHGMNLLERTDQSVKASSAKSSTDDVHVPTREVSQAHTIGSL